MGMDVNRFGSEGETRAIRRAVPKRHAVPAAGGARAALFPSLAAVLLLTCACRTTLLGQKPCKPCPPGEMEQSSDLAPTDNDPFLVTPGQTRGRPPLKSVYLRTELYSRVVLEIASTTEKTKAVIVIGNNGFLDNNEESIALSDCAAIVEALLTAALAVEAGGDLPERQIGRVFILTAKQATQQAEDSVEAAGKPKGRVLLVTKTSRGWMGLDFRSPVRFELNPAEARELAVAFRAAPGIYIRLRSLVDFEAIHDYR